MGVIDIAYKNRVRYTLSHKIKGSLIILEPIGWDEDEKEFAKNKQYDGIFTNFSNNLEFVENGADFINEVRNSFGVNAEINLLKEERHPISDNWTISYEGVLDLSTWEEENFKVKLKFNSSGLETELKARESEQIEIERTTDLLGNTIDPLETHILELEGKKVFLYSKLEGKENESADTIVNSRGGNFHEAKVPFPFSIVLNSDPERLFTPIPLQFESPDASTLFYGSNDRTKLLKIKINISFEINTFEYIKVRDNDGKFIKLVVVVYSNGSNYDVKKEFTLFTEANPNTQIRKYYTVNQELDIKLEEGESIGMYFHTGARTGFNNRDGYFNHKFEKCKGYLSIEEDSFFKKTITKVVEAEYLGNRIIQILTGRKNAFKCDYLKSINKGYSHGHWIRGFDSLPSTEDNKYKPFTTSFKEFVNDLDVTENLGVAIEKEGFKEIVNLLPRTDFYRNEVLIKLPNQVSDVKRKTITEGYYSSLKFGYEKGWDNEEAMGLDEYNTQSNFITPIVRVKNEFSKISKYIYACYSIEFIRRKQILDFPTEDHTNDNEIFGFDMKKVFNGFQLKKGSDDLEKLPTGIYNPETAYNLNYSPLNLLLKHAREISSCLTKNKSDSLAFGSSEGNSNLKTQFLNKKEYSERQDIVISELPMPRYVPEEISFNHIVDFDIQEMINGSTSVNGDIVRNIYGLIEFKNEKGVLEHGYLEKLKPNKEGQWTIIKANR